MASAPADSSPLAWEQIEELFYQAFEYYLLPEWTCQKMSRKVNIHKTQVRRGKANGWFWKSHSGKARFVCPRKECQKKAAGESEWSSQYGTLVFRARFDEYVDEHGTVYGEGLIQVRSFSQGCQGCEQYTGAQFDREGWWKAFFWLHRWILETFYGFQFEESKPSHWQRTDSPHDIHRCEARRYGWCQYCKEPKK